MGDVEIFLFLKQAAVQHGVPVSDSAPSNACMTDFRSILVFDTDGSIIPCPSLQGGEMAYGTVLTGIDFVAESQVLNRKLPDQCLNQCELLPLCMGGCRLQALTRHNDFNGIDCHYDTYRRLLEDYIRAKASAVLFQDGFRNNGQAS
jgi:radical SAM protein with 4Fe4S-binding SPASM domain